MNRFHIRAAAAIFLSFCMVGSAWPQTAEQKPAERQSSAITVRSNLVLVPVIVKNGGGEAVMTLNSDDFVLTDNGVPQSLRVVPDTDSQPLALAVIVQTGGLGADHLHDYRDLAAILDAVIGNVPHRVAVIGFDSKPAVVQEFTTETDAAAKAIGALEEGDGGAAILDALEFGIKMLSEQPTEYRRAILLCSETIDSGSEASLDDAVRAVDDTNTAIYSFAFSSTRAAVKHEAAKLPRPGGGSTYENQPYAPGGCMSKDPNADPDAHGNRKVQALDCASDLLPPLRLARMAFLAARDGVRQNVPESVANLTGGEYFPFKNAKTLVEQMLVVSNDVPNYYVLSFHPQSPDPGFHALVVRLKYNPFLQVKARNAYWVESETGNTNQ